MGAAAIHPESFNPAQSYGFVFDGEKMLVKRANGSQPPKPRRSRKLDNLRAIPLAQ